MEKIYDENQQQKNKKEKKKIKLDGVTILSFAVALLAVVSLVAAGISGFSFALPQTVDYPDSFEGKEEPNIFARDLVTTQEVDYHYYLDNSTEVPLICLQRIVGFYPDTPNQYTQVNSSDISDDAGLLYLLANLTPNRGLVYPTDGFVAPSNDQKKYFDFWVTQMAVWYYLKDKPYNNDPGDPNVPSLDGMYSVKSVFIGDIDQWETLTSCDNNSLCVGYPSTSTKNIFEEVKVQELNKSIKQLIDEAKAKTGISYGIKLNNSDTVETDANQEYYFKKIRVVRTVSDASLGEAGKYTLSVKAYDENNQEVDVNAVITDSEGNVQTGELDLDEINVRIPVNKVTKNLTISVNVIGKFQKYSGKRFKVASATESQEVTTVRFVNENLQDGTEFSLAPAPDTGISAGQTIYFVGLIVLLCGVGIIYANAKPTVKAQE